MARVTPPTGTEGLFLLRLPFEVSPSISYRVGAQREFEELVTRGFDVVKEVYTPAGLTAQDYENDKAAGALLIVLTSKTSKPVYVPDTYIESYPNMEIVPHVWLIASVSIGMVPQTYDTTRLSQSIQQAVADDIGVSPQVTIAVAPTVSAVTQTQAAAAASARLAAIKNKSTAYATILKLQAQIDDLQQAAQGYIEFIEEQQRRIDELEGSAPGTGSDGTVTTQ